jgi:hypothetical protein
LGCEVSVDYAVFLGGIMLPTLGRELYEKLLLAPYDVVRLLGFVSSLISSLIPNIFPTNYKCSGLISSLISLRDVFYIPIL